MGLGLGLGLGLEMGLELGLGLELRLEFGLGLPPVKKPGRLMTRRAGRCDSIAGNSGLTLPVALGRGGEVLLLLGGTRGGLWRSLGGAAAAAVGSKRPVRRVGSVAAPLRCSSRWWGTRRGGVTVAEAVA